MRENPWLHGVSSLVTFAVASISSLVLRARHTMLPLFQFVGDLVTDPVTFEENLKVNESLSLENMRALSRCVPRTRLSFPFLHCFPFIHSFTHSLIHSTLHTHAHTPASRSAKSHARC